MIRFFSTTLVFVFALFACAEKGKDTTQTDCAQFESLSFVDRSDESPAFAAHPFGGDVDWSHIDKYGPGIAIADFDKDGVLDIVFSRSDRLEPSLRSPRIFRGMGTMRFGDGGALPWDDAQNGAGILAVDLDGDQDEDIVVGTMLGGPRLYLNQSTPGRFEFVDATDSMGLGNANQRSYTIAAGDINQDGWIDLFFGGWRADEDNHGIGRGTNQIMFGGDEGFRDSGLDVDCFGGATLGQALIDLDKDGDLDLYVVNDFFKDCLYDNQNGTLVDVGERAGIQDGAMRGMGIAVADLNQDGELDIYVTDTELPDSALGNALYIKEEGDGFLYNESAAAMGVDGMRSLSADWFVSWGVGVEDFDGDGDVEIHVATHGEREELFYRRDDDSTFVQDWDIAKSIGDSDARGSLYVDLDKDGDLDIVVARRGNGLQVLENLSNPAGTVSIEVIPASMAAGATVEIEANGQTQIRALPAGSSFFSSAPLVAHFGVCDAEKIDKLRIRGIGVGIKAWTDLAITDQSIDISQD